MIGDVWKLFLQNQDVAKQLQFKQWRFYQMGHIKVVVELVERRYLVLGEFQVAIEKIVTVIFRQVENKILHAENVSSP